MRLFTVNACMMLSLIGSPLLSAAETWVLRNGYANSDGDAARKLERALVAAGIAAREICPENLVAQLSAAEPGTILLLPNARWFPAEALPALQAFLRRGSHFVAVGGPPFSQLVVRREGRWIEVGRAAPSPIFESISPAYKLHPAHAAALSRPGGEAPFLFDGEVAASIPRSPGFGCDAVRKWRQIPLSYALDVDGQKRGIAAHLLLNNEGEYAGSVWGYLGLSSQADVARAPAWSVPLVVSMVRRIQEGFFFANAGTRHFTVAEGESTSLGAYVVDLAGKAADLKVRFTIATVDGRMVHTSTRAHRLEAGDRSRRRFLQGETVTLPAGTYEVTTTLAKSGTIIDAIRYPFRVVSVRPLKDDDVVSVRSGDFLLAGRAWYPLGINYWPRYILGLEPADFSDAQWDPAQYNPGCVEEDLALAQTLGLSMISIQYNRLEQAGPVMDLLARAHRHNLKVHLFLPGLDPLHPDFPRAEALVRAAHLAESPAVFAYDLGWEVRVGQRPARAAWDRAWERWVVDRYGGIEAAERDWHYTPARENGILVGASDEQLKQDGPWRIYVAAYRRFWDDAISRGYREVREKIRSLDSRHLLGARSGYGGTGAEWIAEHLPFDLASGAKHLDFVSPEHYEPSRSRAEFRKSAFTTAYARLVSGGKPVYWAEFGVPVAWKVEPAAYPWKPDAGAVRAQADYFRDLIETVHEMRANGCAGWWWPAGYRVDEKSDFGIVGPDLTLRPAAEELARAAKRFFEPLPAAQHRGELTIDRDRYVTGYAGIYGEHSAAYAAAFAAGEAPRLRTSGTGTDSASAPRVAVGGVRCNGTNPPQFLNAEFNLLRLNGRVVRDGDVLAVESGRPVAVEASVGNTAEARWLARAPGGEGIVQLAVHWGGGEAFGAIESDTPFLHDARVPRFEFLPRLERPMTIRFRMSARARSEFGEVIRVTFQPVE